MKSCRSRNFRGIFYQNLLGTQLSDVLLLNPLPKRDLKGVQTVMLQFHSVQMFSEQICAAFEILRIAN